MGGLFDKLKKQLENREQEGGITPLDIASLPPSLRKIMRLMLREVEMTYPQLLQAVAEMAAVERPTPAELTAALDSLTGHSWLIRLGQDQLVTYKVNLRRKSGSSLGGGIWAALDSRMEQGKTAAADPAEPGADDPPPGS